MDFHGISRRMGRLWTLRRSCIRWRRLMSILNTHMNSKNKGNVFERKIANLLSARFEEQTGLKTGFRRSSDSGAFFGGKNKIRTETHDVDTASFGDIVSPKDFVFNIECKHYKTPPSFASLVKQEVAKFNEWIKQAEQDGESSGKIPCIIIKYNNVPEVVMIRSLFGTLTPVGFYKGYTMVSLTAFLAQEDTSFFKP